MLSTVRPYRLALPILIVASSILAACAQPETSPSVTAQVNDWFTVNKDYSAQRAVALDQISPANVGDLREVCETRLGEPGWFSSGLLMVGQTIYLGRVNTF